jgi:uncharacterized protein (TIGR03086 family)
MTTMTSALSPRISDLLTDDPRYVFARAVALAGWAIGAVSPSDLERPTPCAEFDVRRLLGHLVAVLRRVAVVGWGGDALSVPLVIDGVADDGWVEAWSDAAQEAKQAWSDPALLASEVNLSWDSMPGAIALALCTSEVTVHTWDLARATGRHVDWDAEVLTVALRALRRVLPADEREIAPFEAVIAVRPGASLLDQLVGWSGRQP